MTKNITELDSAIRARAEEKLKAEMRKIFGAMRSGFRPEMVKLDPKHTDVHGDKPVEIDVYEVLKVIEQATFDLNIGQYIKKEVEAVLGAVDAVLELQNRVEQVESNQEQRE